MNIAHTGRVMVRVERPHYMAMTGAAQALGPTGSPKTRPLFAASHKSALAGVAAAPQQKEWLLHQPDAAPDINPWDLAHQVARGKVQGSEQFGVLPPSSVYAEPDILASQPREKPAPAAALRMAAAVGPVVQTPGPPYQAIDTLNTNYGPDAAAIFSPAWHLEPGFGNFQQAWTFTKGAGVRIAHLDTGYSPGHMSTPRNLLPEQGYNFYEDNTNTVDPYMDGIADMPGHGTATLAILAGNTLDLQYKAGPIFNDDFGGAPDASVVPVRIGPSVIHIYSAAVAQGLDYALAPRAGGKCDVVSLSHGGLPSQAWADACNRLYDAGVVVVAASGDSFYLKIMDVATHFTVYPSAFYRVLTATGATYAKGPYITSNFGVMQGCWGPDAVMQKAVAAYTPNIPWMGYQKNLTGWDMDGGGTSAATPQIAAACALWLNQYGHLFPADWRRVEACRHALFESLQARGADLEKIGGGILDAGAMMSAETLAKVQAAYQAGQLPQVAPDTVSFPFFRLLFGLAPPGPGVDEMYDTEAAQIFFRSANVDLANAVEANPEGDPSLALSAGDADRLRQAFIAEPTISNTLKAYLQAQVVALKAAAPTP